MSKTQIEAKNLKEGKFVILDGEACKVTSISTSKPGKHGAAKAKIEAVGIIDGKKRQVVKPGDTRVDVPIIEKKKAQVLSVQGDKAQLMDKETFEMIDVDIPSDLKGTIKEGEETTYWTVLDVKILPN